MGMAHGVDTKRRVGIVERDRIRDLVEALPITGILARLFGEGRRSAERLSLEQPDLLRVDEGRLRQEDSLGGVRPHQELSPLEQWRTLFPFDVSHWCPCSIQECPRV